MTNLPSYNRPPPELGPIPKHVNDRLVRVESKLSNYIRGEEEEHMLNGQMRVRVCHMEREISVIKTMISDLNMAFKQFKHEWDAEAEPDDFNL